ncbi:MAG: hypothetical protein V3S68_05630, partial [Dehalococcoidia bacterium]
MTESSSTWREAALGRGRFTFARASIYGFLALSVASWLYILVGGDSGLADLFTGRAWSNAAGFIRQLLGLDAGLTGGGRPAFLELGRWMETGKLAYKTLLMSVLAISFAGIGVLFTFLPAARNVSNGELSGRPSTGLGALYHALRLVFAVTRAVPELVWAMVIVFFLSPGLVPGGGCSGSAQLWDRGQAVGRGGGKHEPRAGAGTAL